MNTLQKYEFFRNMSEEDFETFKFVYNNSCTGTFETIAKIVKGGIAALLAYFAYDNWGTCAPLSISSGISAFFLLFNKWSTSIIPSIIGTIKIMNADDRSDKVKKLASVVAKYKPSTKDKAERMVNLEEKLTKLEQEG